jgi:4-amino-4-deoxy-L-arabinose transferase-like glycosyltransferase
MTKSSYRLAGVQLNHASILLILFVGVFCLNLLVPRDLWVQDEARYGEVLREMIATKGWLVPHLNAHPYPDKPPLYFWVVAALSAVFGTGELAFRMATLLSTLAAGIGVYLVGRRLFGAREAFWGTAIFATCFLTLVVGQIVRMDMLLTALTVFSWHALLRFGEDRKLSRLIGFWCLTALAVAVKGPIALLFTALPAIVWTAWTGGWRALGSLRVVSGLLMLAGMVGLWIIMVIMQGQQQYLDTIWHEQIVGRAIKSWSHREPVYFYLVLAPVLLLPWTALVVRGLYAQIRNKETHWRFLVAFSLVPLLGISLVSGKLFIYLEPLVPVLAVAAGLSAAQGEDNARVSRWWSWPPVLFVLICAAGVFWLLQNYPVDKAVASAIGVALVLLAITGIALARANVRNWMFGWMGLSTILSWLLFGAMLYLLNPFFSARSLGESIVHQPADAEVGVVNTTRGILNYYAGRTMQELTAGEALGWWHAHPDAILIVQTDDVRAVFGDQGLPSACRMHETYFIELKEYHVLADC